MSFDTVSYILGNKNGYGKGYDAGLEDGAAIVTVTGSLIATDDGNGLITLTEVNNG